MSILNLSFTLIINGFKTPSENEATRYTEKREAIEQLGKVLPLIIAAILKLIDGDRPIFFRKIDIKNEF